jgi:hypothetical protein
MIELIGQYFNLQQAGYGLATLTILVGVSVMSYWILNKSPASGWFTSSEDVVPPFLALPAILFALFVSALAADIWQKHYEAKDSLLKETAAVRGLLLLSADLEPKGNDLAGVISRYVKAVTDREWSAMVSGDHAHKYSALPELIELDSMVVRIGRDPKLPSYVAARLNTTMEAIRIARLHRIALAHDPISVTKWASAVVLGSLTLITIAVVHIRRPRAMMVSLVLTILCILASIDVLSKNRSPYVGSAAISNEMLVDALTIIKPHF